MFERRGELNKGKDLFLEMDVSAESKKEAIGIGADQGADKEESVRQSRGSWSRATIRAGAQAARETQSNC
jgi:hypothetical protein